MCKQWGVPHDRAGETRHLDQHGNAQRVIYVQPHAQAGEIHAYTSSETTIQFNAPSRNHGEARSFVNNVHVRSVFLCPHVLNKESHHFVRSHRIVRHLAGPDQGFLDVCKQGRRCTSMSTSAAVPH